MLYERMKDVTNVLLHKGDINLRTTGGTIGSACFYDEGFYHFCSFVAEEFNEYSISPRVRCSRKWVVMVRNQPASGYSKNRSSSRLYWLGGIVLLILLLVAVEVYKEFIRWDGPTPNKNKFDISFVTEPSKAIPSWVDHGNGMLVSITIKAWDPEYYKQFQHDGIVIIPTSIQTTQSLSINFVPSSLPGLQGSNGGGPSSFETVVNNYLKQHHLAPLQGGQMNQIGSLGRDVKNVSFPAAIGNGGFPKLQTRDVRLVILDTREEGNQFKVMWSKVYSPMNLSR